MAYLNSQQRDALRDELRKVKFNQAKGRIRRLDTKGKLAFLRNSQSPGLLHTAYDLPTLGVRVILVEFETTVVGATEKTGSSPMHMASSSEFTDVLVHPLDINKT